MSDRLLTKSATVTSPVVAHRAHVRSPVDVVRLIAGLLVIAVGVLAAVTFDRAFLGLRDDGAAALDSLPEWAADVPAAILAAGLVTGILATVAWTLATHRYRRLSLVLAAMIVAGVLSTLIGVGLDDIIDESVRDAFVIDNAIVDDVLLRPTVSAGDADRVVPADPLLAAAVAVLGIASSWLPRRVSRRLTFGLVAYAGISTVTAAVPALSVLTDAGIGVSVAAAIHLVARRHDLAPARDEITEALASIALPVVVLGLLDVDARGSVPWMGRTADGRAVFVKALGRDERSADLLYRAYRWIRIRHSGDRRPFESLQRAVEHGALVSLQAAALGVRTPALLGISDAGLDGVVLAYELVDARSAADYDDLPDTTLEGIWAMVAELHRHRIAHRDLRLANLMVDTDGEPWIVDFAFAELAADGQLLSTDTAELLASTSALVGPERAVAAARTSITDAELLASSPWIQRLALSSATSTAIGSDSGLVALREELAAVCECDPEEPVTIERVSAKTMFVIATIALSAWFLLPQIASFGTLWDQVQGASLWWVVAAVGLSGLTYVGATIALLGAVPSPVPFRGALAAQLASSFANRVTPAKVGGLATNVRYFQRQGIPVSVAISAVGVNGLAGLVVHITMTLVFLVLARQQRRRHTDRAAFAGAARVDPFRGGGADGARLRASVGPTALRVKDLSACERGLAGRPRRVFPPRQTRRPVRWVAADHTRLHGDDDRLAPCVRKRCIAPAGRLAVPDRKRHRLRGAHPRGSGRSRSGAQHHRGRRDRRPCRLLVSAGHLLATDPPGLALPHRPPAVG